MIKEDEVNLTTRCYDLFRAVAAEGHQEVAAMALRIFEKDPVYGVHRAMQYCGDNVAVDSSIRMTCYSLLQELEQSQGRDNSSIPPV